MLVVPCVFYPFLEFNVLLVCGVVSDRHLMDVWGGEGREAVVLIFFPKAGECSSVR